MCRSGPHEVLGEIFACVLGYFGPSIHGELPSHVSIRRSGLNHFGAPGRAIRARRRKVLRRDRVSGDEARSPPARSVRFPHPVPMSSRGVRAAAKKVCREIYTDPTQTTLTGCPRSRPRVSLSIYLSIGSSFTDQLHGRRFNWLREASSSSYSAVPEMLAIAFCTSSALTLNGLVAARPVVAAQTGLPAFVSGVGTAYVALSRPLQVGIPVVGVAALAWAANEGRKREDLLSSGEECMLGDEGKCVECAPVAPR